MSTEELCIERNTAKISEKRYQWAITTILSISFLVIGFLGGALYQAHVLKDQIITNTVEIRVLKESTARIEGKLDQLLAQKN